jgi:hypothetical protein
VGVDKKVKKCASVIKMPISSACKEYLFKSLPELEISKSLSAYKGENEYV